MAQIDDLRDQLTVYPSTLTSNNKLGLALADDITYSTTSLIDGDGETVYLKEKSIKDKIDEIEDSLLNITSTGNAEHIIYKEATDNTEEVTVKDALDSIGDIEESKKAAASSVIQAAAYTALSLSAYTSSQSFVNQLSQAKDEALETIDNKTADIINRLDSTEAGITSLNEMASLFNAALSVNTEEEVDEHGEPIAVTKFAIVSENLYNVISADGTLNENTVYFCYDPSALDLPDTAYSVTLSTNNDLYGYVTGSGSYASGADVVIKAYSAEGYVFNGWKESLSDNVYISTNSTYTIEGINSNTSLIAEFSVDVSKYKVFIAPNDYSAGSVSFVGSGSSSNYVKTIQAGTTVTVTASLPNTGYAFSHWRVNDQDLIENTGLTFQITPSGDTQIIGVYNVLNTIEVSAIVEDINDETPGSVVGTGTLTKGQDVILYATANTGYEFVGWTYDNNLTSTSNPLILLNRLLDLTVTAQFLSIE